MSGAELRVTCVRGGTEQERRVEVETLVIAGWTGRDRKAVEAHIAELERLGVKRPATTPIFYRVAASLLTTSDEIEVVGDATSGEAEAVLVALSDGLWIGVGSDHTDRKAEAQGVALSKQLCAKPVAPRLWRFDEVLPHWDRLLLSSYATVGGKRRKYQEGPVAALLSPPDLAARWRTGGLPPGAAMFGGTLGVIGEIGPADAFEVALTDPVLSRSLAHRYAVRTLPVAG